MHRAVMWGFLTPAMALIIGFLAYPLGRSLWLALHKTAGPAASTFIGLDNISFLIQDRLFWIALGNSLLYCAGFVVCNLGCALLLALWLERRGGVYAKMIRTLIFAPHLIGAVFAAIIAGKMLHQAGPLNQLLGLKLDWLHDPRTALAMVMVVALWLSVGFAVVYIQAALQTVDRSQDEAAQIDGANTWQRFRVVTWPAIQPTMGLLTVIGSIGALQVFELPYLLTGGSGTANSTLTLGVYLYQQGFEQGSLGYAATVGWAMAVVVAAVGFVLNRSGAQVAR